jgi:radical SAM protein with 4Fe4S-binding SPASM domain
MFSKIRKALRALFLRRVSLDVDLIPVEVERIPLKKVINWLLTETSVYFKPIRPWGLPTVLQVEPTNRCNLRCVGCPVTIGLDRPLGGMASQMFRKVVDELRDNLLLMIFWDWGEPFLNPQAYDMIKYAHDAGIKVVSSTNGHPFGRGEHAKRVVESGLDVLVFSVDGTTQASYESFRVLGNLEVVLEGIRRVVAERKRQNSQTPLINLRFIVMKQNEHEVPYLRILAKELGVDALTLRKYRDWFNDSELQPTDTTYQLPNEIQKHGRRLKDNPCKHLWNNPSIHWDGSIVSCFVDYKGDQVLGEMKQQSFKEIWNGETYRKLRHTFRTDWQNHPLCGTCNYGYEGGNMGEAANAEVTFYDSAPATGFVPLTSIESISGD